METQTQAGRKAEDQTCWSSAGPVTTNDSGLEAGNHFLAVHGSEGSPDTVGRPSELSERCTGTGASGGTVRSRAGGQTGVNVVADEGHTTVTQQAHDTTSLSAGRLVNAVFAVPATLNLAALVGAELGGVTGEGGSTVRPAGAAPRAEISLNFTLNQLGQHTGRIVSEGAAVVHGQSTCVGEPLTRLTLGTL